MDKHIFFSFEASSSTIATITYTDWLTRNGQISRDVNMIVTPNVIVSLSYSHDIP